jgi:hypothetical protein
MMMMKGDLDFRSAPVADAGNPIWDPLTAPLLAFIAEQDRPVADIINWGKGRKIMGMVIRQMLAYLSFKNRAHYVTSDKVWRVGAEPTGDRTK